VIIDRDPEPIESAQLVRLDRDPETTRLIRRVFLCLICEEEFDASPGQRIEHWCPTLELIEAS
jgi:hypothetical protein